MFLDSLQVVLRASQSRMMRVFDRVPYLTLPWIEDSPVIDNRTRPSSPRAIIPGELVS